MNCFRLIGTRGVALLVAAQTLGCYRYEVVESTVPTTGQDIRIRLSQPALRRLADSLPVGTSRVVEGTVVSRGPEGIALQVPTVQRDATANAGPLYQVMTFAPGDMLEIERRQLDRTRTGGLVAAAVVGSAVVIGLVVKGQSTGSGASTEPPSNFLRLPIVSFRY